MFGSYSNTRVLCKNLNNQIKWMDRNIYVFFVTAAFGIQKFTIIPSTNKYKDSTKRKKNTNYVKQV